MQIEIILCQDSSTRLRVQWKPLLRRGVWNYELVKLILHELSKMSDHLYHLARCYYFYFTTRSTYFSESSAIVLSTHLVNQCTKKCFFFWNDIQSCWDSPSVSHQIRILLEKVVQIAFFFYTQNNKDPHTHNWDFLSVFVKNLVLFSKALFSSFYFAHLLKQKTDCFFIKALRWLFSSLILISVPHVPKSSPTNNHSFLRTI